MTELLLMSELDKQQREFASTIERSGDTLLQLVNDILDFSKIEAGQVALEEVGFELHELLRRGAAAVRGQGQAAQPRAAASSSSRR